MGERKLNINAPLLSVRRCSTGLVSSKEEDRKKLEKSLLNRRHTLPPYKSSDYVLDQVTEPVAVPFLWEQIPGRRKDGSESQAHHSKETAIIPRLPPGRVLDVIKHNLKKDVDDQNGVRLQIEACTCTDNVTKLESFKDGRNDKGGSDSENDDDAYSDALDSLSHTESLSMNCCVSGYSGSDGPDMMPSRTFSLDPQTRDFMMSRFLRAAKAMALEGPHYAPKKQPVAPEQLQQDKRICEDRRPSSYNQYESVIIPHYIVDEDKEESEDEDEDEDDECVDSADKSPRGCGLLPRLCIKNSLCILNPVPGLKVRTRNSTPTYEPRSSCRTAPIRSQSPTVKKHTQVPIYKGKSVSGPQSPKLPELRNMPTGRAKRFSYSSELQTIGRSSPRRHSISPYRNEAPQSPFHGVSFLGLPKEVQNFKSNKVNLYARTDNRGQGALSNQRTLQGSDSLSPAVEKTLYIDTVNIADKSHSNINSSHTKGQECKDFETLVEILQEEIASEEYDYQDIKCLNISKQGGRVEPKISGNADSDQSSFSHKSYQLDQESKSLECIKVTANGNPHINNSQIIKASDPGNANNNSAESVFPPPLPKSPSESWLWRTLPSVPLHNPIRHSGNQGNFTKQNHTACFASTKWETVVKMSKFHHDHVRYSEELTTRASQQTKM